MATRSKTAKNNLKKQPSRRVSKVMLEVLWRPPKLLIAVVAASLAFSIVGYTALHLSDAFTPNSTTNGGEPSVLKVMPLGDSVTVGDVNNSPNSYRYALLRKLDQDKMRVDYVGSQDNGTSALSDKDNEGHANWRTNQLNENVTMWLAKEKPDIILLQTGASNLLQGDTTADTIAQLNSLLNTISATPNITIYVASLPPLRGQDDWNRQAWQDYNAAIPKIVNDFGLRGVRATFVDLQKQDSGVDDQDMTSGIYPTAGGYEKIADAWYESVRTYHAK